MENQTEQFHRLLILWLDLHKALRQTNRPRAAPWECDDPEVARVWGEITNPENHRVLEEWLFQVASGESELWAQEALLACRRRNKELHH